jgi:hypothetical protein
VPAAQMVLAAAVVWVGTTVVEVGTLVRVRRRDAAASAYTVHIVVVAAVVVVENVEC